MSSPAGLDCDATNVGIGKLVQESLRALYSVELRRATPRGGTGMTFSAFAALGYGQRLIPIIPPKAAISEGSGLFKRIAAGDDARGKAPGVKWPSGKWSSFDWTGHVSSPSDLPRWSAMGAGVGIRCGEDESGGWIVAIDADTIKEDLAALIQTEVRRWAGDAPVRIGRAPKALYVVRVSAPYRYARIEFGKANGHPRERVEILSTGKQFVAEGVHPVTGQPYQWPGGTPDLSSLPIVSPEQLDALMRTLKEVLPEAGPISREGLGGSAVEVDQETLRGDPRIVKQAVAALRNSADLFPTRESYLTVGYAIKAALPDDPELGLQLYQQWCEPWRGVDGEINEPDVVAGDWRRMKPPFRRGAAWLYDKARETTGGAFNATVLIHHEELPEASASTESLFPSDAPPLPLIHATPFDFVAAAAVGPRKSLYAGHYIRQFLSTTIAPSKVGKSSLIICEALAMASGKPLLGVTPAGPLRVWMWNGEDPVEELQRRIVACMQLYGLEAGDIGDRLFVDSGRKMPIVLATQQKSGAVIAEPVERALISTILENHIDIFQVDPFISSHRVSENDNNAIDVVAKRWGFCADVTRCAIEIPHHSRKLNGAEVSVEDGRGASALLAAVRSSRALARMTQDEARGLGLQDVARRLFRFTEVSSNLSIPAPESQQWLELASVNLNNGIGDDEMDKIMKGDSVGAVRVFDTKGATEEAIATVIGDTNREEAVLSAIRAQEWRLSDKAENWVGVPVAQTLGIDRSTKEGRAQVRALVSEWIRQGKLVEENRLNKARQLKTYVVVGEKLTGWDAF